jgi:hypothetical protein
MSNKCAIYRYKEKYALFDRECIGQGNGCVGSCKECRKENIDIADVMRIFNLLPQLENKKSELLFWLIKLGDQKE